MEQDPLFLELTYYTLSHPSSEFIHQYIVDAHTAQVANEHTKPIAIVFALAGLYLHVVNNFTGRQVQLAHIEMSKKSKVFDQIFLPASRGNISVQEVLESHEGRERDQMIHLWCESVWNAYSKEHSKIISMTQILLQK